MQYLRTLGELRLEGAAASALASPRKEFALLAYLLRRAPNAVPRAELAALLWEEREASKSRKSLRQALLELRRALGEGVPLDGDPIHLGGAALGWDVGDFERDLDAGDLERAVARWRGDFIAGGEDLGGEAFRAWLEAERERLRQRLRWALDNLIRQAKGRGAWSEGARWAQQWVDALPLDEQGHRHLVETLHLGGHTARAAAHHAAFVATFRGAFESDPSSEFLRLGQQIDRVAATTAGQRLPAAAALFTPDLIGRGPALAELLAAWQSLRSGARVAVLVEGEAGIGKSRLCDEFLRHLTGSDPVILRARAQESEQENELGVAAELSAALVAVPELAGAPPRALAELARVAPTLRDRFPSIPPPTGGEKALQEALTVALRAVSEERPVVIYVDDLPWADEPSQRVFLALMECLTSGVLFLATARTGEPSLPPALRAFGSNPMTRRLKLQPLDLHEVELLVGSMVDLAPTERHELAGRLYAQGAGNPFYTIELVAALADEGLLAPTEMGVWRLQPSPDHGWMPLSVNIRELVSRRLALLSPQGRAAADAAAVLGRAFDPDLLPRIAGLSPATTAVALEELITRKLVREAPDSPGVYEFTHEITRRVTYELLAATRREALHRAAALAWEAKSGRAPAARAAAGFHRRRAGLTSSRPWRRHPRAFVAAGALVTAVLAASVVLPPRLRDRAPGMASRVAVFPFSVRGSTQYDYLSTGVATLLDFAIDGADSLTSIESQPLLRALDRDGDVTVDPGRARALAERFGARLYILGEVVEAGGRLRIVAALYDRGNAPMPVARATVDGEPNELFGLVDGLARQLLANRTPARRGRTIRLAASSTSSLEAFKAYLEGERALRGRRRGAARDAFRRAAALDSTFALAHYRVAVAEFVGFRADSALAAAGRALRYGARLPVRDFMLLQGLASFLRSDADDAERLYRAVLAEDPTNLDAWYLLGELLQHRNPPRGRSMTESRVPFAQLLALDPGDSRAVWHLARVAAFERNATELDALLRRVDTASSDALRARTLRAFALGTPDDRERVVAELRQAPAGAVLEAVEEIAILAHDVRGAERVAHLLTEPARSSGDQALGAAVVAYIRAARGQWNAARRSLRAGEGGDSPQELATLCFLASQPFAPMRHDELAALRAQLLRRGGAGRTPSDTAVARSWAHIEPYLLGLLSARLGERHAGLAYAAELERLVDTTEPGRVARSLAREVRALAIRQDSGAAPSLSHVASRELAWWRGGLPFPFQSGSSELFLRAEWLRELGREDEALRWYASLGEETLEGLIYVAPAHLRQADIYDRRGELDKAVTHYRSFVERWRDADPDLQPAVESARRWLAARGGER